MKKITRLARRRIESILRKLPFNLGEKVERAISDPQTIQTLGLWTSAIVAGITAVLYAQLFRYAEAGFSALIETSEYMPFLVTPVLFFAAWYLVHRFAPEAAGSGIPQIMAANEMDYESAQKSTVDRLLSLKTAFIKILSSLLCVLGGGAIGREGPTLQISTSIFHFFGCQVRRFVPKVTEHVWVVAGAAAGLASAFNTPLGGIVYAIEELGLVHFHKVKTSLLSAVIVSGVVAQWMLGSYLYLGFPPLTQVGLSALPIAILNGVMTGLLGACFGQLLFYLVKKRMALVKVRYLVFLSIGSGLVIALLSFVEKNSYGSGTHLITGFLFQKSDSSLTLILSRFFGTIVTYLSGAAGGIFSPSLAIGAAVGKYLTGFFGGDHPNLMTLLGMIGFLTGVTRTPFTAFILVLEMTDRHSAIFPMMVAALSAHWVARSVGPHSFYELIRDNVYANRSPS